MKSMTVKSVLSLSVTVTSSYLYPHSDIPIFTIQGQIMAQKATIYKVELSVADMDRHYYEIHNLTVAKQMTTSQLKTAQRLALECIRKKYKGC